MSTQFLQSARLNNSLATHITMLSLTLPDKLLVSIATHLPLSSLNSLSRTSHHLHNLLTPHLLDRIKVNHRLLHRQFCLNDLEIQTFPRLCNAIHDAVVKDHADIVKVLLQHGEILVDPFELDRLTPPMLAAAALGRVEMVEMLLDYNAKVDGVSNQDWRNPYADRGSDYPYSTPLFLASSSGHTAVVKTLLNHGAYVNRRLGTAQDTPLYRASANGHTDTVNVLLEHGADVHRDGVLALQAAAQDGHRDVIKLLVTHGTDISAITVPSDQQDLFHGLPASPPRPTSYSLRLPHLLILSIASHLPMKEISRLSRTTHNLHNLLTPMLSSLFEENVMGIYISSAMHGRTEILARTLPLIAEPNTIICDDSTQYTGYGALHLFARWGYEDAVEMLLERGAWVNDVGNHHRLSPMHCAIIGRHAGVMRLLLAAKVVQDMEEAGEKDGEEEDGEQDGEQEEEENEEQERSLSPDYCERFSSAAVLEFACESANEEIVRILLEHGADVNHRIYVPIVAAVRRCNGVVQELLDRGADPNVQWGLPLYLACVRRDHELVDMLLAAGADVNVAPRGQEGVVSGLLRDREKWNMAGVEWAQPDATQGNGSSWANWHGGRCSCNLRSGRT